MQKIRFILKTLRKEQLVTASVGETVEVIFPIKVGDIVEEVSIASFEIIGIVEE